MFRRTKRNKIPRGYGFLLKHPGSDYRYAICDLCNSKYRVKDMELTKPSILGGLTRFNCKWCTDKLNPQDLVKAREDIQAPADPRTIRSEGDPVYVTNSADDL